MTLLHHLEFWFTYFFGVFIGALLQEHFPIWKSQKRLGYEKIAETSFKALEEGK